MEEIHITGIERLEPIDIEIYADDGKPFQAFEVERQILHGPTYNMLFKLRFRGRCNHQVIDLCDVWVGQVNDPQRFLNDMAAQIELILWLTGLSVETANASVAEQGFAIRSEQSSLRAAITSCVGTGLN